MVNKNTDIVSKLVKYGVNKQREKIEAVLDDLRNISTNSGLSDAEIDELVRVLTTNNLATSSSIKLLGCLIPEKSISSKALTNLLSWFFTEESKDKISKVLMKQFILWIIGIVHFELGNVSIIDSYFHSFLFMLHTTHMETVVSKLLCLLLKPEDANRWTVNQILAVQRKNGPKANTNSLLSILKSFRPDVVPENVPMTRISYEHSSFHESFRKAHERKIQTTTYNSTSSILLFENQFGRYGMKGSHLRLIPTVEEVHFESSTTNRVKKFSVMDAKNMTALGTNCLRIEIPSQTLSLLSNIAGYHVLAFSDLTTKSRFCHKLRYTLFRVFLLKLDPYAELEKTNFLASLLSLQEYIHEGIPVVSEFLMHYLLIWDGHEFREQILHLIQWAVVTNKEDWNECFCPSIRQIFRSSGLHCKYMIIEAMGSLLLNVIASMGRKKGLFSPALSTKNSVELIENIVTFVRELIVEGIVWNNEDGRREMLTCALNFYEICSVFKFSKNIPIVLSLPPALVYGCLYSGSRVGIARLSSLLVRFWQNTVENLKVFDKVHEYDLEVQKARIYISDYYRTLWNNLNVQMSTDSFLYHDKNFSILRFEFENGLNVNINEILRLEKNCTFWDDYHIFPQDARDKLAIDYPGILQLKHLCESEMYRSWRV